MAILDLNDEDGVCGEAYQEWAAEQRAYVNGGDYEAGFREYDPDDDYDNLDDNEEEE